MKFETFNRTLSFLVNFPLTTIAKVARIRPRIHAAIICPLYLVAALYVPVAPAAPSGASPTFAKSENFVVLISKPEDTLESLAITYLGDARLAWKIADFNNIGSIRPGMQIVIPLRDFNPIGITADGYQTVPVLCYHRFGDSNTRLTVTAEQFARQMALLQANNYRVIPLRDLVEFIQGHRAIPKRSVVITIDDGYRSAYEIAFPVLKKHGFPVSVFLYSDFVGARDALSWGQIREMHESGLVDFQPHSRSHSNLALRDFNEDEGAYERRVAGEITIPKELFENNLDNGVNVFAYPYGDSNERVIAQLQSEGYAAGVTVFPGANPAFASPFMLRRTMVFRDHSDEQFMKLLNVFNARDLLP